MFAAMLLAISIVALCQFALYYWRALLMGVAAQPLSNCVLEAADVADRALNGADFEKLAGLYALTPELKSGKDRLGLVRAYYGVVSKVSELFGRMAPNLAQWGAQEQALCARYAAVQIDRRMQANLELAASMRSC
jgi:hypothetical protein